ncbi:hypothetical protein P153DRAFT_378374 [Dothidotthia symphoricarpi CBS 119687]|uniref:Transcription factor domain-containing protein n=1 Tax=Dothidotthia symphoricarpi CBS 119687 TaxID=1392245 RepID=A0A6A6A2S2_9PLEO|nr:uncharacterized protein P153DRAFT_378374 [Dothidotthia symphoricarpi CBS 119687]KAF2126159.1 hypothetical protein P153DRAFT_378374 [Dothidotthia symphoricarpi CBS 119687]
MASTSSSSSPPSFDLDALIQVARGDRENPRQCTKAGADCVFFDHGRNELLPRSYIAELVEHIRRIGSSTHSNPSPAAPGESMHDRSLVVPLSLEAMASEVVLHHDHHFAYAGDSYRYLGAQSCLLKSPRLHAIDIPSPKVEMDDEWNLSWKESPAKQYELMELYLEVMQPVYPILDLSLRYLARDVPYDVTATEKFSLNLIYSIACYVLPSTGKRPNTQDVWNPTGRLSYHQGNSLKYRILANQFFARAMECLEEATVEPTIATLRAVLLLAINSLFDPKTGNTGQQIALAARLAFDLEAKAELQELEPADVAMLKNMHMTIFSLENEVASTLDRPAMFPEPKSELCFDKHKPAEYLCSLFRLQHRFRKSDDATKHDIKKLLPLLDEKAELLPTVRIALHMTHLLLNPVWGSAWHVLEAVVSLGGIHVYLTPHWVYRAGTVLIQNIPAIFGGNLIQLYSNALLVLELSSWKWPSSAALSASLVNLMQHMKTKYRPDWSDKLQQGDVRI